MAMRLYSVDHLPGGPHHDGSVHVVARTQEEAVKLFIESFNPEREVLVDALNRNGFAVKKWEVQKWTFEQLMARDWRSTPLTKGFVVHYNNGECC